MSQEIKSDRVSPYKSIPAFNLFRGLCRYVGAFTFLILLLCPLWINGDGAAEKTTIAFLAGVFLIAVDFGLGILADIEEHTFHSAQAMMDLAQRGKRHPVEAKLIDPAQTSPVDQGKPRRGEPATITPVPPAFGP